MLKLSQTKPFKVVETFDTKCLLEQASVRKGQAEYFFGGPITCMFWVSNHGNFLRGQYLHVAIDVENKSSYDVDHVLISVWEHKVFSAYKEGEEEVTVLFLIWFFFLFLWKLGCRTHNYVSPNAYLLRGSFKSW